MPSTARRTHSGPRWLLRIVIASALAILLANLANAAREALLLRHLQKQVTDVQMKTNRLISPVDRRHLETQIQAVSRTCREINQNEHGVAPFRLYVALPYVGTTVRNAEWYVHAGCQTANATGAIARAIPAITSRNGDFHLPVPSLQRIATLAAAINNDLRGTTPRLVWPGTTLLRHAQETFLTLRNRWSGLTDTATVLAHLMSQATPQTYVIALENEAEMRDQGALLALGSITVGNGTLHVGPMMNYEHFPLRGPVHVPYPAGTAEIFSLDRPQELWQNVNVTPNFPFTAQLIAAMWQQSTGVSPTGVVALDVHTIAALLKATGPVQSPGIPWTVTSANALEILLHRLYELYPSKVQFARHNLLTKFARTVVTHVSHRPLTLAEILPALGVARDGRHLLLWSRDATVDGAITRLGLDGTIAAVHPEGTFHLALENATASKMDYFITTEVRQSFRRLDPNRMQVQTNVIVTNHAPINIAPSYLAGSLRLNGVRAGEYIGALYLWLPSTTYDPPLPHESGLPVVGGNIDVRPGAQQTWSFTSSFTTTRRGGPLTIRWVPSPRFHPVLLTVSATNANGTTHVLYRRDLSMTLELKWNHP